MNKNKDLENSVQVDLPEELANGVYSNTAFLVHSKTEFIMDFISLLPGVPKAKVRSRVIMAPEHAKRLLYALSENINKYESHYGEINLEEKSQLTTSPFDNKVGEA